jgi:hypothetical protein
MKNSIFGFTGASIAAAVAMSTAGVANATISTTLSTNKYTVAESGHLYSVIDVYAACTNQYDKISNFYGQANPSANNSFVVTGKNGVFNAGDAATATNGVAFMHSNSTGWNPSSAANASAWDSFFTIGQRSQTTAQTLGVGGDPNSPNAGVANAPTLQGGYNSSSLYNGPGWAALGAPNDASLSAGFYGDNKIMLGRFSIDITNYNGTDLLQLRIKGLSGSRQNGSALNGGTVVTINWGTQTFDFVVPGPGAAAMIGVFGALAGRRRRA